MPRIYLAVGHGEKPDGSHDPGASGRGWTEQTAGDVIVAEAARLLRAAGADVYSEANRDDPAFRGTVEQANDWQADLVVTIHHDWVRAPEGAFGHWISPAGRRLADAIQAAVAAAGFPTRPSWHKRRTDLYILKRTAAPCVLYEVGRIGQDGLNSDGGLRAMGRAVATGIAGHVGLQLDDGHGDGGGGGAGAAPTPSPEPHTSSANDADDEGFAAMRLLKTTRPMLSGDDVEAVQALLDHHGHNLGPAGVDGWYGRDTAGAVRAFQRDTGASVDGVVGPQTRRVLMGGDP